MSLLKFYKKGSKMISSLDNEKIKNVIRLQSKKSARDDQGLFVVEGVKLVSEAPEDRIREVYATERILEENPWLERYGKLLEPVTDKVFGKMTDTKTPQGLLALVEKKEFTLVSLLEGKGSSLKRPFLMFLENVRDPGNLGTIVRMSEAAGVTGIVMSRETADIYNPKTVRSTMGSIYRMPFTYVDDLIESIKKADENGMRVYAAHLNGSSDYYNFDYRQAVGFVIGNEAAGLTDEAAETSSELVKIPMEGEVESLNAAVAASVLCFEVSRQRHS